MKQAAEWAGVSKPTISKALRGELKGRTMSGRLDDKGQWWIDPSELDRVFGPASTRNGSGNAKVVNPETPDATGGNTRETALLREMLDEVRRERDDLRKDRDHWRDQAETQTRLLTHQQAAPVVVTPPPASATPATPRPGLLARLKAVVVPSATS